MMLSFMIASLFFILTTGAFFWATNDAQKEPYMDEVFHIPQVQKYCKGNFSAWDPMITTLPGLYVATLPLLYPLAQTIGRGDMMAVCVTTVLRGVNILFSLGNFCLLYFITHRLHYNKTNASEVLLTALALGTFPVLYFFTFLYYTDPAAVFFALLTYYFSLNQNHLRSAVAGILAIVCRQTNIMWVIFCTGLTTGQALVQWLQLEKKGSSGEEWSDGDILRKTFSLLGQSIRHNVKEVVHLCLTIVKGVWCYGLVGLAFVAFIILNDGIVVGDRSNHQPCLNFPQVFYFLFVSSFFSFMHLISVQKVKDFLVYSLTHPFRSILFITVAITFILKFTFIHEYNLADNRHYNFYFLSKIIRRNQYSRFILIPAYYYAFWTIWNLLKNRDVFWKLSYVICTAATIIPQRLVEFRYFIIPYLLFRLNMKLPSKRLLMLEVVFYFTVNAWTVYMYVHRPFQWPNSDGLQRFLW